MAHLEARIIILMYTIITVCAIVIATTILVAVSHESDPCTYPNFCGGNCTLPASDGGELVYPEYVE